MERSSEQTNAEAQIVLVHIYLSPVTVIVVTFCVDAPGQVLVTFLVSCLCFVWAGI